VLDIQVNQKLIPKPLKNAGFSKWLGYRWQSKYYSKVNITNRHHQCFILCHFQGKTFINSALFIDVLTQIMA